MRQRDPRPIHRQRLTLVFIGLQFALSVGPATGGAGLFQTRVRPEEWCERRPRERGAVAQLGERCNRTAEVRGSIPLSSTRR